MSERFALLSENVMVLLVFYRSVTVSIQEVMNKGVTKRNHTLFLSRDVTMSTIVERNKPMNRMI